MEWLDRNPLANVTAPKIKPVRRRIPTVQEREKLFAACRSVSERALWMFAYFTGTRPEEYLAAHWSDLNLDAAQWSIERAKVEMPGGLKAILWEEPKTEKSRRKVPLVPRLVACFENTRRRNQPISTDSANAGRTTNWFFLPDSAPRG
jgi:integrase